MARFVIYSLSDPNTWEIRYIGQSTTGLSRALSHMNPSRNKRANTHKENWINCLRSSNQRCVVGILEICESVGYLDAAEIKWIAHGRVQNWPLTNITAGGNVGARGRKATPEQRARLSAAQKARPPRSPEVGAKISAANKGRKVSKECIEKIVAANKGKKRTPETKERMRIAALNRGPVSYPPVSAESIARLQAGRDARWARIKEERERKQVPLW